MKQIYIAAPLFNVPERMRNQKICEAIESTKIKVYLPQRDSGEAFYEPSIRDQIFKRDLKGLISSELVVAILDGRVPDEGTCFEIGYANCVPMPVMGLYTDSRSFMDGHLNIMLEYGCTAIFRTLEELYAAISNWATGGNEWKTFGKIT